MAISTANTILKYGKAQIETATVVGTITGAGNATVVVTATGMTGTPITLSVPVLVNDTPTIVASKIKTAMLANANITAMFIVGGSGGADITLTAITATANIANLNVSIANGTCTGLTNATTSADTRVCTAYSKLIDIINYPDLGSSPSKLDTTTLTATKFKTNILGIQELPDFVFEALYTLLDYTTIVALQDQVLCFQLVFGNAGADGIFAWQGKLSVFTTGAGVDEVRKMKLTLSAETEIKTM